MARQPTPICATRRLVMWSAHLMVPVPLLAVFWRGHWYRVEKTRASKRGLAVSAVVQVRRFVASGIPS